VPALKPASALPAADLPPGPAQAKESPNTDRRLADLELKLDALLRLVEQKLGPFLPLGHSDALGMPSQLASPARNMQRDMLPLQGDMLPSPVHPPSSVNPQTRRSSELAPPRMEPTTETLTEPRSHREQRPSEQPQNQPQKSPFEPSQNQPPRALEPSQNQPLSRFDLDRNSQSKPGEQSSRQPSLGPQPQNEPLTAPAEELPGQEKNASNQPPPGEKDPDKPGNDRLPGMQGANNPREPARWQSDSFEAPPSQRASLKEVEAQIKVAAGQFERNKALFGQGMLGRDSFETSLGQIRLLLGRLEGWDEDLAEEAERLKLEHLKKKAEIKAAMAVRTGTSAIVARNTRLNDRKKGMISTEDIAKADSDDAAAQANVQVKEVERKELQLKLDQLGRRRRQVQIDIAWVRRLVPELAKDRGAGTEPGPLPGAN
jgi:hypothetical protein